jgi:hypothetical protein
MKWVNDINNVFAFIRTAVSYSGGPRLKRTSKGALISLSKKIPKNTTFKTVRPLDLILSRHSPAKHPHRMHLNIIPPYALTL